MQQVLSNGIHLEYESQGSPGAPVILLIMGLGVPLTRWNREICEGLVARGYRVIRFDNRDCGLSTHLDGAPTPKIGSTLNASGPRSIAYTLDEMAEDCVLLLDALGIDAAHIVGISMGGAIAQIVAAEHPERTLSLVCIMSSSGNPDLPPPTEAAAIALFSPIPKDSSRSSIVADGLRRYCAVASPGYPTDAEWIRNLLEGEYERGFYPQGVARQLAAVIANGDRRNLLTEIRIPALVIHGSADPLVPVECGMDIHRFLPDAELMVIDGMGHDLPLQLTERIVEGIARTAMRASCD